MCIRDRQRPVRTPFRQAVPRRSNRLKPPHAAVAGGRHLDLEALPEREVGEHLLIEVVGHGAEADPGP